MEITQQAYIFMNGIPLGEIISLCLCLNVITFILGVSLGYCNGKLSILDRKEGYENSKEIVPHD